jgi:hypothetical protein
MPSTGLAFTTIAEFGRLGIQVWVGREDFNPAIVGKNPWPRSPRPKPSHGFFTSSWDEVRQTSAWMRSESYMLRADPERNAPVFLSPVPSATLLVVDSIHDFDTLASQYPQRYPNLRNPTVRPHWARLAGLVDALHVTASAVTDDDNPYANAWEVESTLWFRGAALVDSS